MEEGNVKKKIIMIIALGIVTLALGIGGVYAYFAATVTQDTTSNVSITAVSGLAISFSNSANIEMTNVLPGQSWTKTFSATLTNNTSEVPIVYSVKLHVTRNTFDTAKGKLKYSLTGAETKGETEIGTTEGANVPIVTNKTIKGSKTSNQVVHSYTLTISYPNNETSIQEQGGEFNGYVYFEVGSNNINGVISLANHEGTETKSKYELAIGDLVTIGTEEFYVIPNEQGKIMDSNGKVRALAKYNLLLGNICQSADATTCTVIPTTTEGYGLQNAEYKAWDKSNPRKGTIEFSNDNHVGTNCASNLKTGDKCYTTYEGSLVQEKVNTYINTLNLKYGSELTGELITKEELQWLKRYYTGNNSATIGNEYMNQWNTTSTGLSLPTWIWSSSYWSGSPNVASYVWVVYLNSYFSSDGTYSSVDSSGVRPVIVF